MEFVNCFICNCSTQKFHRNFAAFKTLYTGTDFRLIFCRILKGWTLRRNILSAQHSICDDCCEEIHEYDMMCQEIIEFEKRLRDRLLATDKSIFGPKKTFVSSKLEGNKSIGNGGGEHNQTVESVPCPGVNSIQSCEVGSVELCPITTTQTFESWPTNAEVEKTARKRRKITCEICDKHFPSNRKLQAHKKWHEKHPKFTCQICYYALEDSPTYRQHINEHQTVNRGQCLFCSQYYSSRSSLRMHVTTVHMEKKKNCLCSTCGKTFVRRDQLRHHMLVHLEDRPHKFSICLKAFKSRNNMFKHEETHNRERKFKCSHCDMKFMRIDHCRVHERRHTQDTKTIKCNLCSAAFEHKFHLNQHLQRKHKLQLPHDKSGLIKDLEVESEAEDEDDTG